MMLERARQTAIAEIAFKEKLIHSSIFYHHKNSSVMDLKYPVGMCYTTFKTLTGLSTVFIVMF